MRLQLTALFILSTAGGLLAQPPDEGMSPRGRGGPGGMMRFNPIFLALDTDGDGELSKAEIRNAAKSLRKLDQNKDGQLTMDEVRPNFPGRGGERRPQEQQQQQGNDPEDMVKRMMAFDKNGDGKLSKDEVPERMQGMFDRGDKNQDGFLTPDEIRAMAQAQSGGEQGERGERRGFGPGGPGGGGRRMDPIFAALDTDHDGTLSKEEIDNAPQSLKALDKNGDGKITMDEIRPPGGMGERRPPREQQQQQQ